MANADNDEWDEDRERAFDEEVAREAEDEDWEQEAWRRSDSYWRRDDNPDRHRQSDLSTRSRDQHAKGFGKAYRASSDTPFVHSSLLLERLLSLLPVQAHHHLQDRTLRSFVCNGRCNTSTRASKFYFMIHMFQRSRLSSRLR